MRSSEEADRRCRVSVVLGLATSLPFFAEVRRRRCVARTKRFVIVVVMVDHTLFVVVR